jgi:hypothetical protein
MESSSSFTEELRRDAKGDASVKTAFNDFFIRNIITRKTAALLSAVSLITPLPG